ncbi:hypothetical protein BC567DRAFT_225815 [Phyllosticta citribraziliensis]
MLHRRFAAPSRHLLLHGPCLGLLPPQSLPFALCSPFCQSPIQQCKDATNFANIAQTSTLLFNHVRFPSNACEIVYPGSSLGAHHRHTSSMDRECQFRP